MKAKERDTLLKTLQTRFDANPARHAGVVWATVLARLFAQPEKLDALASMEATGGEPDVVLLAPAQGEITFCDCAAQSPEGRRSFCYDREGWLSRKDNRPANNAIDVAAAMGIELLDEAQYRALQGLGEFDSKTSSWIKTPDEMRLLGGALFCDRRFGRVFTYHNGAQSYYAGRAFRGLLTV